MGTFWGPKIWKRSPWGPGSPWGHGSLGDPFGGIFIVMLKADSTSTALQSKKQQGTHAAESTGQNLCPSDMYLFQIHTCETLQSIKETSIHHLIINPCFRKQCSCSPRDSWGLTDNLGAKIIWAVFYIHPWQGPFLTVSFAILLIFTVHFTLLFSWGTIVGSAVLYIHPCLTVPPDHLSLFTLHFTFLWKKVHLTPLFFLLYCTSVRYTVFTSGQLRLDWFWKAVCQYL